MGIWRAAARGVSTGGDSFSGGLTDISCLLSLWLVCVAHLQLQGLLYRRFSHRVNNDFLDLPTDVSVFKLGHRPGPVCNLGWQGNLYSHYLSPCGE